MSAITPAPDGANGTTRGSSTQAHRVARLDKAANIDSTADVETIMEGETNRDMKRMLFSTVGRLAQAPEKRKVERLALISFLNNKRVHEKDCWQLPMTILYFVFFAVTVLMHEDIANVSQVERNVRALMEGTSFEGIESKQGYAVSGHKSMSDIDTITDIWTYLNDAIIPWFIPDTNSTLPRNVHRVMRYNQIIGGVQLQQIRRVAVPCSDEYPNLGPKAKGTNINPLLAGFMCYPWNTYADGCFGGHSEDEPGDVKRGWCPVGRRNAPTERRLERILGLDSTDPRHLALDSGATSRRLVDPSHTERVRGGERDAIAADADGGGFDGGIYTVVLHEYDGLTVARETLNSYNNYTWLDTASAWFGLKVFMLNPDLAVYTHLVINVFMPPSGELIPYVSLQSFPAEPYQDGSTLVCDIIWGVLWFHLAISSLFKMVLASGQGKCLGYMSSFWNWVDWMTVLGGAVIILFWALFLGRISTVKQMAMDVVMNRPTLGANPPFASVYQRHDYFQNTDDLHAEVGQFAGFLMAYRLIICWYTILIMVRFFRAFKAQPRLAVVTNTIARSATDLAHFLVVLSVVIMSYAVAGMFMFGHRMLQFSQLSITLNTCMMIMIGDFDFAEMGAEHPLTSVVWFWSYMVLVSLIMLNMLLAIILDIYSEVKADSSEEDAVWTQAKTVLQDSWRNRDFVKWSIVQDCLEKLPDTTEYVDKDLLLEIVPDITEKQARELIATTEKHVEAEESQGLSISDAMKMVGWIKIAVQKVARRIEDIMQIEKEEKELLLTSGLHPATTGGAVLESQGNKVSFDPIADQKMQALDARLAQMEIFMKESANFSVGRSREMRNRLAVIEDLLQANKDVLSGGPPPDLGVRDEWDIPPRLTAQERTFLQPNQPPPPPSATQTILFSA